MTSGPPTTKLNSLEGKVKNVVIVISGKGGVGKSFTAAALALGLSRLGYRVAVLDCDLHGPSIPWLLGVEKERMTLTVDGGLLPIEVNGIAVVSIELLLESKDRPVIWRGPMKSRAIMDLLNVVKWGERDVIVVDMPPGTGDEPLTVIQLLKPMIAGGVLVLTPGRLVKHVAYKAKRFLEEVGVKLIGVVMNMSYFKCPVCGTTHRPLGSVEGLGDEVKVLAEFPIDPRIAEAAERGALLELLALGEYLGLVMDMARSVARELKR